MLKVVTTTDFLHVISKGGLKGFIGEFVLYPVFVYFVVWTSMCHLKERK